MLSSVVLCVVSELWNALTFIGGDDMDDGSDGSGDSGLYALLSCPVLLAMAIVANILKGLGGRFKSFRLGGMIG